MKKKYISFALFLMLGLSISCGLKKPISGSAAPRVRPAEVLVFQTGFEGTTKMIRNAPRAKQSLTAVYPIDNIIGCDTNLKEKSDFIKDMDNSPDGGQFMIEYTGGDSTKRFVDIVPEPGNPDNKVLSFLLKEPWEASEHQVKARIQADIYSIKKGYREFYQSVRVFLSPDFNALKNYPDKISWLTISEFWNNEWWVKNEPYGFRVTLGIGKSTGPADDLHFILNAENDGQKEVWNAGLSAVKVPVGQWFKMDYYFKEGNHSEGRFYLAITPENGRKQVVFDVHDFTQNTRDPDPDGVTGFSPMKLYTSRELVNYVKSQGKTLNILWDDFKIWKYKVPE